jgi:hypothetical protein
MKRNLLIGLAAILGIGIIAMVYVIVRLLLSLLGAAPWLGY